LIRLLTLALLFSNAASAGWLVQCATVSSIAPVADKQNKFYVIGEGGTGNCANDIIHFPVSEVPDESSHNRVFTATAFGNKVNIYDYNDEELYW
jgi:hypothetical protein